MSNKRYYWLKLKNDFFEDDTIKWLEEQENGKDYVIFYLKLALKSLTDNGALIRYVGEKLIPYDVKALAKLTDTPVDTVAVAMKTFEEIGLISVSGIGEIYLNQIDELIGSETDSAVRKRKQRTREIENESTQKLIECDIVTEMSQKCHTDIRDKRLDIRDKRLEIEKELSFVTFWNEYPKKVGKAQAEKTFKKIVKDEPTLNAILLDLRKRKNYEQWTKDKGKYIPNPSTYLNQERWLDEYETGNSSSALKQYQELFGNN